MSINSILITGAAGFVGSSLIKRLQQENVRLTATVLEGEDTCNLPASIEQVIVQPFSESSDCSTILQHVDIVIHLAARVHIMNDTAKNPLHEFRQVNLHGTQRLAFQAARAGVKRFVFISTIGVHGNSSDSRAFTECDDPSPHNPYAVSKLEAEICLKKISETTGMEVVIVRAPLVYGPGNPGNFLSLLRIVAKGIPMPLASVQNRKSFLYVENLADALSCCTFHQDAAGHTYLVCDGKDVSTPELIRAMASALGSPARLFPFPSSLLRFTGKILGKPSAVEQLLSSLQVDCSKIQQELGWKPPFTMEEGLVKTAEWFRAK